MIKLDFMMQGDEIWKSWRRTIISGTDSSIIMGLNPFKTRAILMREKLLGLEIPENEAMRQGSINEPIAREIYNEYNQSNFQPICCISSERSWQGASLDGYSDYEDNIIEIKCGKSSFNKLNRQGIIEPYYLAQMQHMMSVCGEKITSCMYICFYEGKMTSKKVDRDDPFIRTMIEQEFEFKEMMDNLIIPKD